MKTNFVIHIPARGGSKGIPDKNLYNVAGYPLVYYTIKEALTFARLTHSRVVVNTDSSRIACYACSLDPSILIYRRPEYLATDDSTMLSTIQDFAASQQFTDDLSSVDSIITLQPTCPLRNASHIIRCAELFEVSAHAVLAAVCDSMHHPCELIYELKHPQKYELVGSSDDHQSGRRQSFKYSALFVTGAVYIHSIKCLPGLNELWNISNTEFCILPQCTGIDIDNEFQMGLAGALLSYNTI